MATEPPKGRRPSAAAALEAERDELRAANAELEQRIAELTKTAGSSLVSRIAEAMNEAAEVTKSATNEHHGYKYASAEAMLKAVRGPLFERSIILTTHLVGHREAPAGGKSIRTTVLVDFVFRDGLSAEVLRIDGWQGSADDTQDKGIGKAYTSAIKTFLRTQWLLPTEHDDPEKVTPPNLPAWSAPLTEEDGRRLFVQALADLTGEENAAKAFDLTARHLGGPVPRVAADVVHIAATAVRASLQAELERARAAQGDPSVPPEQRDADAQAWAGEPAADDADRQETAGEPEPEPIPPASVEDPLMAAMQRGEQIPQDPAKQAAALRKAGCICKPSPFPAEGEGDPACPIIGHGTPAGEAPPVKF